MVFLAALAIGWQRPPAEEVLKGVIARYQKMKSLTVKIIHHADFMSDTKNSIDSLSWAAPKRFELVSDKTSVPKLICDGKHLTTFIPDVVPITESFNSEQGRSKPWESRGGLLLSILMRGPVADQLLHPEKPIKISFDYGRALHWHEESVTEVIETISVNGASEHISYYLSANCLQLLGMELVTGPESSWTQYKDTVENPDLPKTLGTLIKS